MNDEPEIETIPKPDEVLALHGIAADLFNTLRRWFGVPDSVAIDLTEVDSAVTELGDPLMVAAMAMRKLQALHLLAMPGVLTRTDVVVTIINDIDRALVQAPAMRLKVAAETTDWDQALLTLQGEGSGGSEIVEDATALDPEVERFHESHQRLRDTVMAVIQASDGQIRYLT